METDKLVASVARSRGEEIRIREVVYSDNGRTTYYDIRLWFYDDEDQVWKPTKKGFCAQEGVMKELVKSLKGI